MRKTLLFTILISLSCLYAQFGEGEILKFDISYGIITAGSVTMEVEADTRNDSIPIYRVFSKAKTTKFFDNFYKVRDLIEIEFSQDNYQTWIYNKKLNEGKYHSNRMNLYYPELGYAILIKKGRKSNKFSQKKYDIPEPSHDIFTTFFRVRSLELIPGDTLKVTASEDGKVTTVDVVVHRTKKMETIFGEIECLELEPLLKGTESVFKSSGDIFIYLTNDDKHIPVLLESEVIFGSFRATLKGYTPGK